jgi:hypothetical protein
MCPPTAARPANTRDSMSTAAITTNAPQSSSPHRASDSTIPIRPSRSAIGSRIAPVRLT